MFKGALGDNGFIICEKIVGEHFSHLTSKRQQFVYNFLKADENNYYNLHKLNNCNKCIITYIRCF